VDGGFALYGDDVEGADVGAAVQPLVGPEGRFENWSGAGLVIRM
jgi:hypothetical protein